MFILRGILSALATVFAGLYTIFYAFLMIVIVLVGLGKTVDFFLFYWANVINFLSRIEIQASGLENIPQEPCLFVFNHQSLFDIPIILATIRKRIRFGAKKELYYIPIFGQAMVLVGALIIDRGDRPNAIETLKKARNRILKGKESFILAAEGTRQKEDKIGEFKSGPFILAIEAQCPLVPVVIAGAYDVLPKNELFFRLDKAHPVKVQILPPVPTKGHSVEDRQKIKTLVREKMEKTFDELKRT